MDTHPLKRVWASWKWLLALLLLTMPAWLPLLRSTTLPCTHDNAFHYFRIAAMRDALRHGWLFSRWIPNLALGYGYPFFNYREPLPYLIGEFLYTLGLPLPFVLGLGYALSLIFAAAGCYVLCRDVFGQRAAWVGAVAYALAPYVLLDAYRRGNLPESIALALLPWLLFHFRRLIIFGGRRSFLWSLLLLVCLFLSHNISSLLLAPLLGIYILYYTCLHFQQKKWPLAFWAVGLAVMLTAWFWIPALFEQDFVQLNLSTSTRNNDFHYNFLSWQQILWQMPVPYDPDYLNPPMEITLGIGQTLLAFAGIVTTFFLPRSREQRGLIILSSAAALGYMWMSTPYAVRVWEAIPLLAFVQFPWRLLGRALLPISMLGASAFTAKQGIKNRIKDQLRWFRILAAVTLCGAVGLLVLSAYPDMVPPKGMCSVEPYPDIADVSAYELQGWLGMDPEQSYFPVEVEEYPADAILAEAFAAGQLPERLDVDRIPSGAEILASDVRVLSATIHITTPSAFRARWKSLYFPGWQVRIDGHKVPVVPEDMTGLITFDVPAGDHNIVIRFGGTPLRTLGVIVMCIGIVLFLLLLTRTPFAAPAGSPKPEINRWTQAGKSMLVLAVVLLLVRISILDRVDTVLRHSRIRDNHLPEVESLLYQPFDDHLVLLGTTLPELEVPGDGEFEVDLLWQATGNPHGEYWTTILVKGPDGQAWSPAGTLRPAGYESPPPTTAWNSGQYVYDPHIVSLFPGTPPGTYDLEVVIFDRQTLQPLSVVNVDGSPGEPALRLGTIEVKRPALPVALDSLGVGEDMQPEGCRNLALWAMSLDRSTANPGGIVAVRWVWEKLASQSDELGTPNQATLALTDSEGHVVATWLRPLSTDWWPVARWQSGERWIGRYVVRLPVELEGGDYHADVYLQDCEQPLATADLTIDQIDRLWEVPPHFTRVDVIFSNQVSLAGYDLPNRSYHPGETIILGLSWQATSEMATSYRVFLHLVDAGGRVIDQDDGEPVNWTRPTTGWLEGEVVTEVRELVIPEDTAVELVTVNVGLYAVDGSRLVLPSGENTYALTHIQVIHD